MRTAERWQETLMPKLVKTFTPRIQKDLQTIPFPADIAKMTEVPSEYIYGDTEHGKTIRSIFLFLQEHKNLYLNLNTEKKVAMFVSVPTLFEQLKSNFNKSNESDVLIEQCKQAHFLVLDDIGVNKSSEWANDVLYLILNHRYEYLKKTVITSNFSIQQLSEQFGDDRITSRIQRMCEVVKKKNWRK